MSGGRPYDLDTIIRKQSNLVRHGQETTHPAAGDIGAPIKVRQLAHGQLNSLVMTRLDAVLTSRVGDAQGPHEPRQVCRQIVGLGCPALIVGYALLGWVIQLSNLQQRRHTYHLFLPRKAQHGRDALFVYSAWDVVLAEPTPGPHTLLVAVTQQTHSGKEIGMTVETTEWVIYFTVEGAGSIPPPNRIISVEPTRSQTRGQKL